MSGEKSRTAQTDLMSDYLRTHGESLSDWTDDCSSLALKARDWLHSRSKVALVATIQPFEGIMMTHVSGSRWTYHNIVFSGGMLHDPWIGRPLTMRSYVAEAFPGRKVEVDLGRGFVFFVGPDGVSRFVPDQL